MSTWWYAKGGERFGPIEEAELRAKLVSAEIQPTDLVWREGMDNWQSAMEAFPATPEENSQSPQSPTPGQSGQASQMAAPQEPAQAQSSSPLSSSPLSSASGGESKALALGLKDYGDILCWGIAIIIIPCLGFFGYIALMVLFILEFIEVKKAVEEGKLAESQYSRVHPALLGLGLFCCSIIFYPLFMHWRNESGYFKPQPNAVWFAIVIIVVSIGIGALMNLAQYALEAAGQY